MRKGESLIGFLKTCRAYVFSEVNNIWNGELNMLKKILSLGIALIYSFVTLDVCAVNPLDDGCDSGSAVVEQSGSKNENLYAEMLRNFFLSSSKNDKDKKLKEKFLEVYSEVCCSTRKNGCFLKFCTRHDKKSYIGSISKTCKDMERFSGRSCLDFVAMKKPAGSDKMSDLCKKFMKLAGDYITGGYFMFFENEKWMVACTFYFWNSTLLNIFEGRSVVCDFIDEFEKFTDRVNLFQTV